MHFLRGFERIRYKKLLDFWKLAKKFASFFEISLEIVKTKTGKHQNYQGRARQPPSRPTLLIPSHWEEEKPKAAFACRFGNKIKAINSWYYPVSSPVLIYSQREELHHFGNRNKSRVRPSNGVLKDFDKIKNRTENTKKGVVVFGGS